MRYKKPKKKKQQKITTTTRVSPHPPAPSDPAVPTNIIPWRLSTKPRIDSDNPEHAEEIRYDPAGFTDTLLVTLCLECHNRGEPPGIYEDLQVKDIESITIRGEEVSITFTRKARGKYDEE